MVLAARTENVMKNVIAKAAKPIHPIAKKTTGWKGAGRCFQKD